MKPRSLDEIARALRRDFDASFGSASAVGRPRAEEFLSVVLRADPYAIALADIAGVHRDWRVVPVASSASELLGIAGNRGSIVPVYDLGALLGYPPQTSPRWFLTTSAPRLALAVERVEGQSQVLPEAMSGRESTSSRVRGTVIIAGTRRPVVDVGAIVDSIVRRGA